MFVIWLAIPGLRRTARKIAIRMRIELPEIEAEMVAELVEQIPTINVERPEVGGMLIKSTIGAAWSFARQLRREVPIEDIEAFAAHNDHAASEQLSFTEEEWEVDIMPPHRSDGLSATLRFTASRKRIEGERLGMLAGRLGLQDVVYRARRSQGGPVGSISLQPVGDGP